MEKLIYSDLDTYVEAISFARKLAEVEPLKSMIVYEVNPGSSVQSKSEIGGAYM
jgi:hypothetical protein